MRNEIRYLGTDLDLWAPVDLRPLADALVQRGLIPRHMQTRQDGSWAAGFAVASESREPDQDIARIITAIEALDEPVRSLWAACTNRDFDIGYDCGDTPQRFSQQLLPATVARIAAVGACLVITIYPVLETEAVTVALDLLKKYKWIKRQTGKANGYGIHHTDSSLVKKNQADVKVTFYGKKKAVFVHCLMELTSDGEWGIKEILKREAQSMSFCPARKEQQTADPGVSDSSKKSGSL